jgi:signal transduction histidine kinase
MTHKFGKRLVVIAFISITVLLTLNILFTYRNSLNIEKNTLLQQQSEEIKTTVSKIAIDIVHNLDLGIRSYALFKEEKYLYPFYVALQRKDSILAVTEDLLIQQKYSLSEFHNLKDSIDAYASLNQYLKQLVDAEKMGEFYRLANRDRGYKLWLQFERFASNLFSFENQIQRIAKKNYNTAVRNNYVLQFILFIICIPTLIFTTIHTFRTFRLETELREAERERADMLKTQNENLEVKVLQRTEEISKKNRELQIQQEEIAAQNEEIKSQNEQLIKQQDQILAQRDILTLQNKKLENAHKIILAHKDEIKIKNDLLEIEVERKTKELVIYNQQLEQFAFLSAHNLRAPVARILGLGKILDYAIDTNEANSIIKMIIGETTGLDSVVKDLNILLEIQSNINSQVTEINFNKELDFIKSNLEKEIAECDCEILEFLDDAPIVVSVKSYIDSILYNLVSNAIKYRSPARKLTIRIKTSKANDSVCLEVQDNGIGIDLMKHGQDVFSLYKRFHAQSEGKGLGLHLVKMQALALGGYVDVTSSPGVGSTFKVYFKVQEKELHG